MNDSSKHRLGWFLGLGLAVLGTQTLAETVKPIRLRKEIIHRNRLELGPARADAGMVGRLALVQFDGIPQPTWRQQLTDLNVELLHYVPEDAYLVRLNGTPSGRIRQLPFVSWVGAYRPDHKLHPRLEGGFSPVGDDGLMPVSILLAPEVADTDASRVRGRVKRAQPEVALSRGSILRGAIAPSELAALAESDAVLWVEPRETMQLYDEVSSRIVGGDGGPGQTLVQSLGYDGSGVTVAVADSGLDSGDIGSMHPDLAGRVSALFHYGSAGQLSSAADEHGHGTHCAGIVAGNGAAGETDEDGHLYGLGVAPGAGLVGQRLFGADGSYAPAPTHETMTRDATRAGADIGSNSWGDDTQGAYDLSAMEFDALVRDADLLTLGDQPYILEFSAGNAGPGTRTIGSPAVAKNVIATGAANSARDNLPLGDVFSFYATGPETMADFSSRGPCADGRIKPDLVAPGTWIASLRSVYANDAYAWWPVEGSQFYSYQGGTSQAGPHASGAAAVFVQYYRDLHGGATPSPALVKAALINSATDMDDAYDTSSVPNMDEGWGRLDLEALLASAREYTYLDQSVLLTHAAVYEHRVLVGPAAAPLKITLTYTDVPGTPLTIPALVNDLDLEVTGPDGRIYRGNLFARGESVPDLQGADAINNVEGIYLGAPTPGEYVVRVRGTRLVEDARRDTAATDQDFALVVSGIFAEPGVGLLSLDRQSYTAPDTLRIVLVDDDLAGQPMAAVQVRSSSETPGETVMLTARGASGVFTGTVTTATGPVQPDGLLQVGHRDQIEAWYTDATPAADRLATAQADLQAPVIANVSTTERFGDVFVSWETDEPAGGEIVYTSTNLTLSVTNHSLETASELQLVNVVPYQTYQFLVVSTDAAGNRSTNDNQGALYTFSFTPPPDVLLLDSYSDYGGLIAASPLSGYTDALVAAGAGFDLFDATGGAEPTPAQLQAYRCVIWRMDEVVAPSVGLAQSIADFVRAGGSLLIASMDAPTRLAEAGLASFNSDILQLQAYTEDQPVDTVVGTPGEPVGMGIDIDLDYSPYQELFSFLSVLGVTDPSDWIVPNTNSAAAIRSGSATVGIRAPRTGVDLPGRVVYLSFPLDAVPMGSGIGNNRPGLIRNILGFLAPVAGGSSFVLDREVYAVPAPAVVEVEDLGRVGQGRLTARFSSPQEPGGVSVILYESARPGLFRGSLHLLPTDSGLPGSLVVQSGDTIHGTYLDPASGRTHDVTATIETSPPVISNVSLDPGYLEALLSWETSEDSDALVQYSESPNTLPVNHTAYDPQYGTSHALYLTQLRANQTYYYRVISRDRAGNVATDDNNGQLYRFTTLETRTPPWQDDLEGDNQDWSAYVNSPEFDGWERGIPGGGETAHSPSQCWGSNLDGGPLDIAENYLISPAIHLEGGNQATLRFWHNYDFALQSELDLLELGAVEIITNVFTDSVLLTQFDTDASAGWQEVEIDLTPYLGEVVYVVWHYVLLSADYPARQGWLVDDVSVTMDTVVSGTLQITNNLWQAVYAVSGPSAFVGSGRWTVITNAVAGEYQVEFGDVAHYQTPPPQTHSMADGETLTIRGHYAFADVNTNDIPDGWEVAYFGSVDPLRRWTTDTDGDGMSDGEESIALTDPTDPLPEFLLEAERTPDGLVLQWPSSIGLGYRVWGSTTGFDWAPLTGWLRAEAGSSTFTNTPAAGDPLEWFRVDVDR